MLKSTKLKNKTGRPLVVLTDEQIAEVEDLSAYLTCEQIADYFGISHDTFTRIKQRDDFVLRAYKRGKVRKIYDYAKKLEAKAMGENIDGDATCLIFFLKTQAKWSTLEGKEEDKPKLNFSNDKSPLDIIDSVLEALKDGKITTQQAQQVSSLALAKQNIKASTSMDIITTVEKESNEQLMAKVHMIKQVIDYTEGKK